MEFQTTVGHWPDARHEGYPEPVRPSAGDGHRWELRASSSHGTVRDGFMVLWYWELVAAK